jgi:DNA processing protein
MGRWRVRLDTVDPRRDLATLRRFGGRLLIPQDDEWPGGLGDLGEDQPYCLWVRGPLDLSEVCSWALALVGSRTATNYGLDAARQLAVGCADAGVTVVSGAAYGIDAQAHRSALAARGRTVAVLACGVDRAYPRGNERLIEELIRVGCVLAEVPPGSSPTRWRFLERNRLIAAMSGATVVVEAAWRSGAQSTARHAAELNRPLGAVPGPVTSAMSAGCHRLLREGAVCVSDAGEAVELLGPIGALLPGHPQAPVRAHDQLTRAQLLVFEALPVRSWAHLGGVSRAAGLPADQVVAGLGHLLGLGLAECDGGRWRRSGRASP